MNTLDQWLDYISRLHHRQIDLGLDRISIVAELLGLVDFPCPVVTVAGTNGKGSTVILLRNIYQAAGYRAATYTSPHLFKFNERIYINDHEITDEELIACFSAIEARRSNVNLSYFEYATLAALYYFQQQKPDIVIMEVGLGGRLDACNVVNNDIAIITSIDLDHCDRLGDTRELIGYEKAGIFRPQAQAICGDLNPPDVIARQAKQQKLCLWQINQAFHLQHDTNGWQFTSLIANYANLPNFDFYWTNVACVLMATALLTDRLPMTTDAIATALQKARLPGRFEVWASTPTLIFDVAHNPAAAKIFAVRLRRYYAGKRIIAVVGMLADKDHTNTLLPLIDLVDSWYIGGLQKYSNRGASAELLLKTLQTLGAKYCYNFCTVCDAAYQAWQSRQNADLIIVFGSFFTVSVTQDKMKTELIA